MNAFPDDLADRIAAATPGGCALTHAADRHGVTTAWCELAAADDLLAVGALLKAGGARLSTITVLQPKPFEADDDDDDEDAPEPRVPLNGLPIDGNTYEILYHFDLGGHTLSLDLFLPAEGGAVPSLTPLFRNADWNERELMEMFSLRVTGHPDPRRLFLDEAIDPAALERLIPFSTLVNAASTKSLWEKIIAQKEGEQ